MLLVVIFLTFYVGSYFLLVRKQVKPVYEIWRLNAGPGSGPSTADGSNPQYLWNAPFLHTVFTPLHWFDRRIRTEYWGPDGIVWEESDLSRFTPH